MIKIRDDEPKYAFLQDKTTAEKNRYGKAIDLTHPGEKLFGESLNINGDEGIGDNPNRYKQHGFYFNADNCIGCHACETACSEKNDNPAHLSFRSVGFVEGGTYPDYQRINISMACNHCDDPVCLKGCPTRAYTKFAEYGAVLQDPDICFGCGYCTWVCPYNAPQLDPVKGQVSKCNMCVDRLEVGLKPSCVAACLGNALDFGVVENIPENRDQALTEIPGFPTPEITHPNIRFQSKKQTHREMTRTDVIPLKYHKHKKNEPYKPTVDKKEGDERHWNLKKLLGSHESAHVIFTLFTQASVGAFLLLVLGDWLSIPGFSLLQLWSTKMVLLSVLAILTTVGLYKLNMHLGKPHRFYRGFYNLKLSPVSREIAGVTLFYTGLLGTTVFSLFDTVYTDWIAMVFTVIALVGGPVGLYFMYKLYRIPARPFWNHWQTGTAFFGNMLSLGALIIILTTMAVMPLEQTTELFSVLFKLLSLGVALEAVGHFFHSRDMKEAEHEGAASFYWQTTRFGNAWIARNVLLGMSLLLGFYLAMYSGDNAVTLILTLILALSLLVSALFSRSLFFVTVIPTTMPGAFFWKNQGFIEHAREIGLADNPQHGVVYERHHPFKVNELIQTIKETTLKQKLEQIKAIFMSS